MWGVWYFAMHFFAVRKKKQPKPITPATALWTFFFFLDHVQVIAICQPLVPLFCTVLALSGGSADETFQLRGRNGLSDADGLRCGEARLLCWRGCLWGMHGDGVGQQKCSQRRLIDKWLVIHARQQLINRKHSSAHGAESGRGPWENEASSVCAHFYVVLETGWHACVYITLVPFGFNLWLPFCFRKGPDTHVVEICHTKEKRKVSAGSYHICKTACQLMI